MSALASTDSLADQIRVLAEEAASGTDLFVVGVEVRGYQGSRVVSVYADSESSADADDLAALSRSLSFLLDTEDMVKGRYRLDVSTPGAEQPLSDPRQYAKHVGRVLDVTYETAGGGTEALQGELKAVHDDALELDADASPIPFDAIREARVTLPW